MATQKVELDGSYLPLLNQDREIFCEASFTHVVEEVGDLQFSNHLITVATQPGQGDLVDVYEASLRVQ